MNTKQEFDYKIDNSVEDNIPDMFKVYNELYTQAIHTFESGIGIDLRRNEYK